MRAKTILVIGVMVLLTSLPTASAITWQEQMLVSINSIRAEKSLAPLTMCRPLAKSAQGYAKTMASQNFFDHTGKDGSTPGSRIQKAGYDWMNPKEGSSIAENIAAGQNSVPEVMKGWRKSKSHYKNMGDSRIHPCGIWDGHQRKVQIQEILGTKPGFWRYLLAPLEI
jgi:uncharacterized protein YkwD